MNGNTKSSNNGYFKREERLKDKVALITGGARGIGAATAKLFASNGAHVVIADVLDDLGASVANTIGGLYVHCDVAREKDVELAVRQAVAWGGRLDVMFNNAGIVGPDGGISDLCMHDVKATLDVNVIGTMHGIKHAARAMRMVGESSGGSIICMSSSAAIMGGLASHAYTLSKAAVLGVVKSAACELGAHGIRVNCILPHGVPSEMLVGAFRKFLGKADVGAEDVRQIVADGSVLQGKCPTEDDVAEAALFFANDDSSGLVTGQNLVVDGGFTSANRRMRFVYH